MKTKQPLKKRLINVLKTDVSKWNRYIKFSLSINVEYSADLRFADLHFADLSSADLRSANLRRADLSSADLRFADLSSADLRFADLRYANLSFANLSFANLRSADLDMSCLDLSCKSLRFKSDLRIRTQIAFHFASLIANAETESVTEDEKKIYSDILEYVNKFHRTDVEKLKPLQ
jgi:hypothetical protein